MASDTAPEPSDQPKPKYPVPVPEERRREIFISYGHDESAPPGEKIAPLPEWIRKGLEARGHTVWIDSEGIVPGDNWAARIKQGIELTAKDLQRGRVLLLMTPHSIREGGFCENEILYAQYRKVRIVPVKVLDCTPPIYIFSTHYFEMLACVPCSEKEQRYGELFEQLAEELELTPQEKLTLSPLESTLEKNLPPIDYRDDIKFHMGHFTGRDWVFEEVNKWLNDSDARRGFVITGLAGTGKSAIVANLCTKRPDLVKAYHICVYSNTFKSDPRNCIRSIAYQLSTQFPVYRQRLGNIEWERLEKASAETLFDELIAGELADSVPAPGQNYLLVIDALDEADDGKNELVNFVASHFERGPDWLRLLVTTRPVPRVMVALSKFQSLDLNPERSENLNDIREYVKTELTQARLNDKPLTDNSDALITAINTVVTRSEGVFLYAYWVCDDLRRGNLRIDDTASFPQGLRGVYQQFFDRLYPEGKGFKRIQPLLGVIAAGYDAMPKEVIYDICKLNDATAKPLFDPLKPLFPCVDDRYRPFHKSILDWLSDLAHAADYYVDIPKAHQQLADYCWRKCEDYIKQNLALSSSDVDSYPFRHGVRHLIEARRFADAVNLLDYMVHHAKDLTTDQQADLDQLAKLLTIALGDKKNPPDAKEAKRIPAQTLADLIQDLYMVEPLKGGVRLLMRQHAGAWPGILQQFLDTEDYVLRHTIAEVLAEDYLKTGDKDRLQTIYDLLDNPDVNHQELGAYAVQEVYAGDPTVIEPGYLNRLANGAIYSFRSALGDLLLALTLPDFDSQKFSGLEIMSRVDASSKFWNPIWKFNRMDVASLKAISYFIRKQPIPVDEAQDVIKAHDSLWRMEKLRQELLAEESALPQDVRETLQIRKTLESYYSLGADPDIIPEEAHAVRVFPGLARVFEVLFAYPLWDVTETAASLLASIVDDDPLAAQHIRNLFNHDLWRVCYGAAEASFVARYSNRNQLFRQAIGRFFNHEEPLLRANIAENLAAWILDTIRDKRIELLREFENPITYWLNNEDEDAWVLDHVHRLFHQLHKDGHKPEDVPLMKVPVSGLLGRDPQWYVVNRREFLLALEERRSKQPDNNRTIAAGGKS